MNHHVVEIDKPTGQLKRSLDLAFDDLDAQIRASAALFPKGTQLYTTDAGDLFDLYLKGFDDPVVRQYHNCSSCRHFLNHYGGLVVIVNGAPVSYAFSFNKALLPPVFQASVALMQAAVEKAKITGMFFSKEPALGQSVTGQWTHIWAPNPSVFSNRMVTAGQHMAAKKQEFDMLRRGMDEFPSNVFEQAVVLLGTATGLSTDKFKHHAGQLLALRIRLDKTTNQRERDSAIWSELALHGEGFARVRSSALGTLLENLKAGMAADQALKAFMTVVDPMSYMRALSAPKAGNIKRAEEIVAQLGLAPAFERRYASLVEALPHAIWSPAGLTGGTVQPAAPPSGLFAGLKTPDGANPAHLGVKATMTWEKFAKSVLPTATYIELIPAGETTFGAITAPVHADAPPLFAWDKDDARNPYSWYRWNAAEPSSFGVTGPTRVTATIPLPCAWGTDKPMHHGVVLILQGAEDSRANVAGLGLFPDLLRNDLREVRSTVFAHSARGTLAPADAPLAPAVGLVLRKGFASAVLRVTVGSTAVDYAINGWD